jgi:PIN domain-containing protein
MSTSIFLDANIWLHFLPVEDIDWCTVASAAAVEIIVLPVLVDELDKLKDSGSTTRTRERARRALRMIENWNETADTRVRSNVTGRLWFPRVALDVAEFGLDASRGDDRLLAQICTFVRERQPSAAILITNDTGPRLKARRLGIIALEPAEELQLPAELDGVERENRELKRQLERARAMLPKLALRIVGGADSGKRIDVSGLRRPACGRDESIASALAYAEALAPTNTQPSVDDPPCDSPNQAGVKLSDLERMLAQLHPVPASEYERYARERESYFLEVSRVAGEKWDMLHRKGRTFTLVLELENSGSGPADDIGIFVHIPDGPDVREHKAVEEAPDPKPPVRPKTQNELMLSSLMSFGHAKLTIPDYSFSDLRRLTKPPANVSGLTIKRSNSFDVELHARRLKQHERVRIVSLDLEFSAVETAESITVSYRLNCATLPDPVVDDVHVVIVRAE